MDRQQTKAPRPNGLTDKQNRLLSILVETPNITDAAKQAGIGRSTAHRWLQNPAFRDELFSLRQASMKNAMNTVHAYTAQAVEGLVQLLDSSNEWLKRQVCMDILNRSLKIREAEDLEQRVSALEQAAERQKTNQTERSTQ